MSEALMAAKKAGRPKSGRNDISTKVDRGIYKMCRAVAESQGITVAELISETLRPIITPLYWAGIKSAEEGTKPKAPPR